MDNLQKKVLICLVMALIIVVFIPFYWIREPARQSTAIARIQKERVASTIPSVTPVATPKPVSSPVPGSQTQNTPKANDQISGEELYQRTAGGAGCAICHGADAYGSVGPNIRGSSVQEIKKALGTVASMSFIKMTDEQIEAVSAYLKYLQSQ